MPILYKGAPKMASQPVKCLQMSPKCLQMSPNVSKCLQMSPKCLQNVSKCLNRDIFPLQATPISNS